MPRHPRKLRVKIAFGPYRVGDIIEPQSAMDVHYFVNVEQVCEVVHEPEMETAEAVAAPEAAVIKRKRGRPRKARV